MQGLPVSLVQPNIWVATVIFANSQNSDFSVTDAKASLTIQKKSNYTISPFEHLDEVAYYKGIENPVTYMRKFKKDFSCDFQLHTYPFDTQVVISYLFKNKFFPSVLQDSAADPRPTERTHETAGRTGLNPNQVILPNMG